MNLTKASFVLASSEVLAKFFSAWTMLSIERCAKTTDAIKTKARSEKYFRMIIIYVLKE